MDDDRRLYLIGLILARVPEMSADEFVQLIAPEAETPLEVTNQILDVVAGPRAPVSAMRARACSRWRQQFEQTDNPARGDGVAAA
jgi:hypothetical protein